MSVIKYCVLPEDKSFTSTGPNVNMKCGEDHAMRKKPDIMLSLGHKGNVFADQTPTPTRFIRNCEEVGLFQDLQNVNPFEETFRRAAEAVKNGEQPLLGSLCLAPPLDDTLHTPNVFPQLQEPPPTQQNIPQATAVVVPEANVKPSTPRPPRKYSRKIKCLVKEEKVEEKTPHCVIVSSNVTFKLPIPRLPLGAKVYSPNYFSTFSKHSNRVLKKEMSSLEEKTVKCVQKNGFVRDGGPRRCQTLTKTDIMERNRIAAVRTREKKKHYLAHLEKMKNVLGEKMTAMEQQIEALRSENSNLKGLLNKCKCSKTHCSYRHMAQQTDSTEQIGLNEKHGKSDGTLEDTYNEQNYLGSATKEVEKEVFYATIPQPMPLHVFSNAPEPPTKCFLRKPFKKRNLNSKQDEESDHSKM